MADSFNILYAEAIEFTEFGTDQLHELGSPGMDQYGNEFVYLQGVASTTKGDLVQYAADGTTALATIALMASARYRPLAVACAAIVASSFGWYLKRLIRNPDSTWQINTLASDAAFVDLFVSATPGSVTDAATEAGRVQGLHLETATGGTDAANTSGVWDFLGYTD